MWPLRVDLRAQRLAQEGYLGEWEWEGVERDGELGRMLLMMMLFPFYP
jgi:hypothetical protein